MGKRLAVSLSLYLMLVFTGALSVAQEVSVTIPEPQVAAPAPAVEAPALVAELPLTAVAPSGQEVVQLPAEDFLAQVVKVIHDFGGLSIILKMAAIASLLIASMKVSFLRGLIWDKLGASQGWVAPLLGLLAGILNLGASGPVTWASILVYVGGGAGAIILHELLDSLKKQKGIGPIYIKVIDFLMGVLGARQKSLK